MQASVAEASTSHYAAVAIDQPSKGAVASSDLSVLPRIYGSDTNLAIWRRNIAGECQSESAKWLERNPTLQLSLMASPETIQQSIISTLRVDQDSPLVKDMAELVEMFCVLFELTRRLPLNGTARPDVSEISCGPRALQIDHDLRWDCHRVVAK